VSLRRCKKGSDVGSREDHANAAAEPVLAVWGIDTGGKPVFVGLDTAAPPSA
jgi:hypothetical protein